MIVIGARMFSKHHFGIGPISLAWMTEAFGCRGARLCDEMTRHGLAHNITLVRIDVFPRALSNRAKTLRRRSVVRRCDTPARFQVHSPRSASGVEDLRSSERLPVATPAHVQYLWTFSQETQ